MGVSSKLAVTEAGKKIGSKKNSSGSNFLIFDADSESVIFIEIEKRSRKLLLTPISEHRSSLKVTLEIGLLGRDKMWIALHLVGDCAPSG